jgi:hypothetical protein
MVKVDESDYSYDIFINFSLLTGNVKIVVRYPSEMLSSTRLWFNYFWMQSKVGLDAIDDIYCIRIILYHVLDEL